MAINSEHGIDGHLFMIKAPGVFQKKIKVFDCIFFLLPTKKQTKNMRSNTIGVIWAHQTKILRC